VFEGVRVAWGCWRWLGGPGSVQSTWLRLKHPLGTWHQSLPPATVTLGCLGADCAPCDKGLQVPSSQLTADKIYGTSCPSRANLTSPQDGVEELNTVDHNLAAYVHVIGQVWLHIHVRTQLKRAQLAPASAAVCVPSRQ
jgi:hypothetical protein